MVKNSLHQWSMVKSVTPIATANPWDAQFIKIRQIQFYIEQRLITTASPTFK
jgi:hypothetical protein